VTTIHGPYFVDIQFDFDLKKRRAKVSVPGKFETESAPLTVPASGDEQRVIVRMPGGFEYKEMEVAGGAPRTGPGGCRRRLRFGVDKEELAAPPSYN
jgi:hypothetical protein